MQKSILLILMICLACTSANFGSPSSPVEEISSSYLHQVQFLAEYPLEYVDNPFAFSPDGNLIAINHGRSVSIVQLSNLELISTINPPFGPNHTSPENDAESIQALAFLSNETLVTGSSYSPYGGSRLGSLRLWDTQSGREIAVLEEEAAVWNLIASTDGQYVAYFRALEIVLMKLEDRSIIYQSTGTNRFLENYMGFTANNRYFAIWSAGDVSIINLENLEEGFISNENYAWYEAGSVALALSPDSNTIALWSYTELELVDLDSLEAILQLNFDYGGFIGDIAFVANEFLIVGGSGDSVDVEIYDIVSGQSIFSLDAHGDTVFSLGSHPYYPLFLTGGRDGVVKLWELGSESPISLFEFSLSWGVYDVAFCPNENCFVASSDRGLQIWGIE